MCNKSELMAEWILSIYDSDPKNDIILESPERIQRAYTQERRLYKVLQGKYTN